MSTRVAAIIVSERSILAAGVVATLKKGGYGIIQHVDQPSGIKLTHVDGTRGFLVVLVSDGIVDHAATCQLLRDLRGICPRSRIIVVRRDYDLLSPEAAFMSERTLSSQEF